MFKDKSNCDGTGCKTVFWYKFSLSFKGETKNTNVYGDIRRIAESFGKNRKNRYHFKLHLTRIL